MSRGQAEILKSINAHSIRKQTEIRCANGEVEFSQEILEGYLHWKDKLTHQCTLQFVVCDKLPHLAVLGMDILKSVGVIIHIYILSTITVVVAGSDAPTLLRTALMSPELSLCCMTEATELETLELCIIPKIEESTDKWT